MYREACTSSGDTVVNKRENGSSWSLQSNEMDDCDIVIFYFTEV